MTRRAYWLGSSAACKVPEADAAWVEEFWPKLACPACSTLLPQEHPKPLRIVLADDAPVHRFGPTGSTAWPFSTGSIERSLAELLELPARDFALGEVVHRGDALTSHWSYVCSARLRIPQYGNSGARYTQCTHCRRTFGSAGKTMWIRAEDINGLQVFSSVGGTGLYVTEEMWIDKGLARWPRIQTHVIEVVAGVDLPRIHYEPEDTTYVQTRVAAWHSGMR